MKKYIRCEYNGKIEYGYIEDDKVSFCAEPYWINETPNGKEASLDDVKLLCPVQPSKIICVGLNYRRHVKQSQSATEPPKNPMLFMKPPSALIGQNEVIEYPDNCDRVDYEAELAVIIGTKGRRIPEGKVTDHIFGYTCLNDVTARHIQKADGQWTRGKGFDTFCPVGPYVVTGIDASDISVEAYLNGEQKQCGKTSDMIFKIPELISFISGVMTLEPGDVISTGTPQGIDPMQIGDTIEVRIENIGSLINTVG
ncbi:MAG: fumarylacetoacetate hydrolase family protein [candidate division Zixibacteria bacterium]|nr:fumarylacetoacetate hydrolase family protein [candidate division Zixibacteria bacterium]